MVTVRLTSVVSVRRAVRHHIVPCSIQTLCRVSPGNCANRASPSRSRGFSRAAVAEKGQALQEGIDVEDGAVKGAEEALDIQSDDLLEIGIIRSAHGLRGEMKVESLTSSPEERLGTPGPRWLQATLPSGTKGKPTPATEVRLVGGRKSVSKGNDVWLVRLSGTNTPEEAKLLRGHRLLIRKSDRKPLTDEDEFYAQDLIGLSVQHAKSGARLGRVVDVYDGTGTHDVLRVLLEADDPSDNRVTLVPFVKEIVPSVDTLSGTVIIDPPEGLLEISTPATRKHRNPRNKPRKL